MGSPILVLDSPSQRSASSGRGKSSPIGLGLRKVQTMREWELEPEPQPKSAHGELPRRTPPQPPSSQPELSEFALPPSPSPRRRRLPQLPQWHSPRYALSPSTPRRTPNRPANSGLVFSASRPNPARILTYDTCSRGTKRPRESPRADVDSLPTPPPSSPSGRSKRLRLGRTDQPVPLLSPAAARNVNVPKTPATHGRPAKAASEFARLSACIQPPTPATPTTSSPAPVSPAARGVSVNAAEGAWSEHAQSQGARGRASPSPIAAPPPLWPTSSPLADRVRNAKAALPRTLTTSMPRPLSLRSRLRRAGLSVP